MKYLTESEELSLEEISRTEKGMNRTADDEYILRRLEQKVRTRWDGSPETKDVFLAELADIKMVQAGTLSIEEY